eukprot:4303038-Amphidinium_carterae.1
MRGHIKHAADEVEQGVETRANRIVMPDFGTFLAPFGRYIRDMLASMQVMESKSAPTPISQMRIDPEEQAIVDEDTYRKVVSIARYLRQLRLDIGFAVKCLSHGLQAPTETEWAMLKRLYRYLAGSENCGLILPGLGHSSDGDPYLEAWSDSDWAADRVTRKSTSACILTYRGALIFDSSKQQSLLAQTSGEAETYAAASSVSSSLLIEGVLRWLGLPVKGAVAPGASQAKDAGGGEDPRGAEHSGLGDEGPPATEVRQAHHDDWDEDYGCGVQGRAEVPQARRVVNA